MACKTVKGLKGISVDGCSRFETRQPIDLFDYAANPWLTHPISRGFRSVLLRGH